MKKAGFVLLVILIIVGLFFALKYSFRVTGDTATMIAGLWSALATAILGAIALFQNHRYKKLSDKVSEDMRNNQAEIRLLTEKMATAVSTLQTIERTKYYPDLEDVGYSFYGKSETMFEGYFDNEDYVFQYTLINIGMNEHRNLRKLACEKNIFAFCLKNMSEKTIRNFICDEFNCSPITSPNYFFEFHPCDIKEGQTVIVCLVNMPDINSLLGDNLSLELTMQNLLSDTYKSKCDVYFYEFEDDHISTKIDFISPEQV